MLPAPGIRRMARLPRRSARGGLPRRAADWCRSRQVSRAAGSLRRLESRGGRRERPGTRRAPERAEARHARPAPLPGGAARARRGPRAPALTGNVKRCETIRLPPRDEPHVETLEILPDGRWLTASARPRRAISARSSIVPADGHRLSGIDTTRRCCRIVGLPGRSSRPRPGCTWSVAHRGNVRPDLAVLSADWGAGCAPS